MRAGNSVRLRAVSWFDCGASLFGRPQIPPHPQMRSGQHRASHRDWRRSPRHRSRARRRHRLRRRDVGYALPETLRALGPDLYSSEWRILHPA